MIKKRVFGCLLLIGMVGFCHAVDLTISQSGVYQIGGNIDYDPGVTVNDSIILISASNVTLDLSGSTLSQTGVTAGLKGVEISSGLSNITIKNGTISVLTGTGIVVNSNCSNIVIQNVDAVSCLLGGFALNGAASPNQIRDSFITGCNCIGSGATAAAVGVTLSNCTRINVVNCEVSACGNTGNTFTGFSIANSSYCTFMNAYVAGCSGTNVTGFNLSQSLSNYFMQSMVYGNQTTGANTLVGFDLLGAVAPNQANFNIFDSCVVQQNSAVTAVVASNVHGFRMQANSQSNICRGCIVDGNSSAGIGANVGFSILGGATNLYNSFIRCVAQGQSITGAAGVASGFQITGGSNSGIIIDSVIANNSSTGVGGIGIGIDFSSTGGSFWSVRNNQISRNSGVSDATSFGIRRLAGANNLFTRNVSFFNGVAVATSVSGNQLNGVSAGSRTVPAATATNNIAAVTASWTNLAVAA